MVLKKPYVFLIKHFKLIHLILLLPLAYVAYKTGNIATFFSKMAANNYVTNEVNIASHYINMFLYLCIAIIVLSSIAIYYLMKEKNKQTFFYMFLIVFYSLLFFFISMCYTQLFTLENNDAIAATVRMFRDFTQIAHLVQYPFLFFTLFRAIGFDIKSFNFSKDLEELELEESDEEEIEISFGKNNYKYKRDLRKFIREIKYYVLENKFVFTLIGIFGVIVLASTFYVDVEVYNKKYSLNQPFNMSGLTASVKDSILTTLNYDGTVINEGKMYLALKIQISNKSSNPIALEKNNIRIELNKKFIYPTIDKTGCFIDYGDVYYGGEIKANTTKDYVFVYEFDESQYRKKYTVKVLDNIIYKVGEINPKYKILDIKPSIQNEVISIGKTDTEKQIKLKDTTLGDTEIKINDYYISNTFEYEYETCINNNCNTNHGTLFTNKYTYLIIDADINLPKETYYLNNSDVSKDFFSDFGRLEYKIGKNKYQVKMDNKTPQKYKGKYLVYQLPKSVDTAEKVELTINVRNKKASIKL